MPGQFAGANLSVEGASAKLRFSVPVCFAEGLLLALKVSPRTPCAVFQQSTATESRFKLASLCASWVSQTSRVCLPWAKQSRHPCFSISSENANVCAGSTIGAALNSISLFSTPMVSALGIVSGLNRSCFTCPAKEPGHNEYLGALALLWSPKGATAHWTPGSGTMAAVNRHPP